MVTVIDDEKFTARYTNAFRHEVGPFLDDLNTGMTPRRVAADSIPLSHRKVTYGKENVAFSPARVDNPLAVKGRRWVHAYLLVLGLQECMGAFQSLLMATPVR